MLFPRKPESPDKAQDAAAARRRHHMAALWAAELLGLIGQAAQDYARDLVGPHDRPPDDERVVKRLSRDLRDVLTVREIRETLSHLWHPRRHQPPRDAAIPPASSAAPGSGPPASRPGGGAE